MESIMLLGQSILNGEPREGTGAAFQAFDPTAGTRLDPVYHSVSIDDVDTAARLADDAFATYSKLPGADKASFLRHIAAGIESIAADWWSARTMKQPCPNRGSRARSAEPSTSSASLRR